MTARLKNRKGMLDILTTAILLITFIVVIIFMSVSIAMITIRGDASGKVLLQASVGSIYNEQRNLLYLTDDYENKMPDMMGQALLEPSPKIVLSQPTGIPVITVPAEAIDNSAYACSTILNSANIGTDDAKYSTKTIDLTQYLHCYVIPKKLGKMYGKGRYCLSAVYAEGELNEKKMIYGNETLGCADEKKVTAEIAPPPGFDRPIYLRLIRT